MQNDTTLLFYINLLTVNVQQNYSLTEQYNTASY